MAVNSVINKPNNSKTALAQTITAQAAGAAGGYAVALSASEALKTLNVPAGYNSIKYGQALSETDNRKILTAFDNMITQTGLKLKGLKVKIFSKSMLNHPDFKERFKMELELDKKLQPIIPNEILRNIIVSEKYKSPTYSYITGINAGYNRMDNTISFADNTVALAHHEAGHAVICNSKSFANFIDKSRYFIARNSLILGTLVLGLLTRKHKAEEGKPLTFLQKAENAIHNNLGWLVSALTLPTLINEYQATHIGKKYIKAHLPKNLYSKIAKVNRFGFASYCINTLALGIGAACGVKAKDKISEKIQSKLAERQAKQKQKTS